MSRLYHELAGEYHLMYQEIFDYRADFEKHREIFSSRGCRRILELGCGSGSLGRLFSESGFSYTGTDVSAEMIELAERLNPGVDFIRSDMRELSEVSAAGSFDAVFSCGRSFTYMTTNRDVLDCLGAVNRLLKVDGILVVDNFLASRIFRDFRERMETGSETGGVRITRISENSPNLETGWTWNWNATYIIEKPGSPSRTISDPSILRAFLPAEMELFLSLCGFDTIDHTLEDFSFRTVAKKRSS